MNTYIPIRNSCPRLSASLLRICYINFLVLSSFTLTAQQSSLACNTRTAWVNDGTFGVSQSNSSTGLSFWTNPQFTVDANTSNFAVGNILLTGSVTLRVSDTNPSHIYDAGNFAGFRVSSSAFSLGLFTSLTIRTYLNGGLQESQAALNLIGLSTGFLSSQIDIGFITTMDFNQIEISIGTGLGITTFDVYHAVMEGFCAGPELACNTLTAMNTPVYPMTIDYANTGSGGLSVGFVDDPEDAISASTTDYAVLSNVVGVAGSTFIAIEDQVTDYPAGTFVGFDIENTSLLGAGLLENITITTYLNGVQ